LRFKNPAVATNTVLSYDKQGVTIPNRKKINW
jgi:hypothetical protein